MSKGMITFTYFVLNTKIETIFNPFCNKNIIDNLSNPKLEDKDYKELFTLTAIRIYDSVDFWRQKSGINGYYKMLEEYVIPTYRLSDNPFVLEDKFLIKRNTCRCRKITTS